MRPDKDLRGFVHGVHVEPYRNVPYPPPLQRKLRTPIDDPVKIDALTR